MVFDVGSTIDSGGLYKVTKVLSAAGGMSSGRYLVTNGRNTYFAKVFDIFDASFKTNGFKQEDLDAVVMQFSNEYDVLERVRHRGVPSVITSFSERGFSVVVSEYISGTNLEDMLKEMQRQNPTAKFSEDQAIDWILELCNILEYLHTPNQADNRKAIVHRDVKPANVILGKDGLIYLVDFGTAKIRSLVSTQQKTSVCTTTFGSPGYAAPEQYDGKIAESTMDVYSLGATMYRLLSGEIPLSADMRVSNFVRSQDYELKNAAIHPELEKLIQKMTALMVRDRYQSISEVRTNIQKIRGKPRIFAQPTRQAPKPTVQSKQATPTNDYGVVIPSRNTFSSDSVFYIDPAGGGRHYLEYASGLVNFNDVCRNDPKSRQPIVQVSQKRAFGFGQQVKNVCVPLTLAETFFAQLMQPYLAQYWKFTRSVIAYPDYDNTRFKIATKYDPLIDFLIKHPYHNQPGIYLKNLPEGTYDEFPGVEVFRRESAYNTTLTKTLAVNNKALLAMTDNNPDLIAATFDLVIKYYDLQHDKKINELMGVYLSDNSSSEAQVHVLSFGPIYSDVGALYGGHSLKFFSFVRVAQC